MNQDGGNVMSKAKLACGLLAAVVGGVSLGCSNSPGIVRAQSPGVGAQFGPPSTYAEPGAETFAPGPTNTMTVPENGAPVMTEQGMIVQEGQPVYTEQGQVYSDGQVVYQNGAADPYCPPGGYTVDPNTFGRNNDWFPQHMHKYSVSVPHNLTYPPQDQPAAVVFYPYYTVKGPSDFFMK